MCYCNCYYENYYGECNKPRGATCPQDETADDDIDMLELDLMMERRANGYSCNDFGGNDADL